MVFLSKFQVKKKLRGSLWCRKCDSRKSKIKKVLKRSPHGGVWCPYTRQVFAGFSEYSVPWRLFARIGVFWVACVSYPIFCIIFRVYSALVELLLSSVYFILSVLVFHWAGAPWIEDFHCAESSGNFMNLYLVYAHSGLRGSSVENSIQGYFGHRCRICAKGWDFLCTRETGTTCRYVPGIYGTFRKFVTVTFVMNRVNLTC